MEATHTTGANCADCALHNDAQLVKMGIDMKDWDAVVALAGNPNTGKSTVFNALTGLRQHVGNWPGKTVARAEGGFSFGGSRYKLVDLPGTYSLMSSSADEEVARDFILFGQPDVTVVVVDATRLERNLNLAIQVLQITSRVVVALNLMDEAARHGIEVDVKSLAKDLGVPVIPMAARQGEGIPDLLSAIEEVSQGSYATKPHQMNHQDSSLESAIAELAPQITALYPRLPNTRWVAMRMLDGDESILKAVEDGTLDELSEPQFASEPLVTDHAGVFLNIETAGVIR